MLFTSGKSTSEAGEMLAELGRLLLRPGDTDCVRWLLESLAGRALVPEGPAEDVEGEMPSKVKLTCLTGEF